MWAGNALNAATMAMTAINFNRETFRDEDSIRIHPIITKGGEAVSAVPADVAGPANKLDAFGHGAVVGVADAHQFFAWENSTIFT